jgi:phage gpG-like protein
MTLIWRGREVTQQIRDELTKRLNLSARTLENYAKENLSKSAETKLLKQQRKDYKKKSRKLHKKIMKAKKGFTKTLRKIRNSKWSDAKKRDKWVEAVRNVTFTKQDAAKERAFIKGAFTKAHSLPGDFPYKQSGHLRRNVASEVDGRLLLSRYGTNVKYGKYLEQGTKRMAARPWMSLTNAAKREECREIMEAPYADADK